MPVLTPDVFPPHEGQILELVHNQHLAYYDTVAQTVAEAQAKGWDMGWTGDVVRDQAVANNEMWQLHIDESRNLKGSEASHQSTSASTLHGVLPAIGFSTAIDWPAHAASLHLSHDEWRMHNATVREWLDMEKRCEQMGDDDWISVEQQALAIEHNSVWALQWYPNSPVGFNRLYAYDLKPLLEAALTYSS